MIKKVILVFKTHVDIGFTDLAAKVIDQYAGPMLSQVLETCRSTKDMGKLKYVWTMPAWLLKVVIENCQPELRAELDEYINNGQIVWHALAYTSHTDFCGEEEYLESLRYAKELAKAYQKPYPVAAKMTDVPGHGRMLPEILAASGINFLHLGCNEFATSPKVPDLFYWQAPSGRKVLTMYGKGGYGSSLETPEDWEFPVWMALVHTHDNCGPHSAEFIRELEQEAKNLYPDAEIICGTMDDFYHELAQCDLSKVPTITEDMADTWIHGIGSYPEEVGKVRQMRKQSVRLQKKLWQLEDSSLVAKAQPLLDKYYENMQLFGEHTWGADVKTWLGPERVYQKEAFKKAKEKQHYQFMEQSWAEQKERVNNCEQALQELADIVGEDVALVAGQDAKEPLVVQQENNLSYVENHRYRLEFEETTGKICSLIDKQYQSTLLKARNDIGLFSYRYTRHGIEKMTEFLRKYAYRYSAWGIQDNGREAYPECVDETFVPTFESFSICGDTICFKYQNDYSVKAYGDAQAVWVEIKLPSVGEEILVELKLFGKQESPYLETGSFCMPMGEGEREYLINKNGSVLNPKTDIREQANHVYYAVEEFVASDDGRHGICVMPKDTPLLSIGEDGMYQYRQAYEQRDNVLFFNAFNNMWGTNFPQWLGGDYSYRFVLWGYESSTRNQLYKCSIDQEESVPITRADLKLDDTLQLLNIKNDADDTILITRDLAGESGMAKVRARGYKIVEVDYFGRVLGEANEDNYSFEKLKYGLHLFKLTKI